jgi:hypothetical protein
MSDLIGLLRGERRAAERSFLAQSGRELFAKPASRRSFAYIPASMACLTVLQQCYSNCHYERGNAVRKYDFCGPIT